MCLVASRCPGRAPLGQDDGCHPATAATSSPTRTNLGFWAGSRNSKIRVTLSRVWENGTELAISNNRINRAIGELVYQKQIYRTKSCICPGGSQINSAHISVSRHYGCMPGSETLHMAVHGGIHVLVNCDPCTQTMDSAPRQ